MTVYNIFELVGVAAVILTGLRYFLARPTTFSEWVVCFLQNFVGALFLFSGFVKAVDPIGTGYKMHEYFEAFAGEGLRPFWEWLANYSTLMSIVMIAVELFIGLMLIIGWQPRFTVTIIWWLTLFFTFLTGYTYLSGFIITKKFILASGLVMGLLALLPLFKRPKTRYIVLGAAMVALIIVAVISKTTGLFFTHPFNEAKMKVTDCGCFGDFIKLQPWQTFYKDVFLDVLIFVLVLGINKIKPAFKRTSINITAGLAAVVATVFCLYNTYWNEPMIDFRPYAIGNDIDTLRFAKRDPVYDPTFIYRNKKTGEVKGYKQNELSGLSYDELDFVKKDQIVIDPGDPAKIEGFLVFNDEEIEISDTILKYPGYSLIVISPNLDKTHETAFAELNTIAAESDKKGIRFFAITTNNGHVDEFRHKVQAAYPFYTCDETPLKTMMRSNPGLLLLKDGVVVNKWHYRHLPNFEKLNATYFHK